MRCRGGSNHRVPRCQYLVMFYVLRRGLCIGGRDRDRESTCVYTCVRVRACVCVCLGVFVVMDKDDDVPKGASRTEEPTPVPDRSAKGGGPVHPRLPLNPRWSQVRHSIPPHTKIRYEGFSVPIKPLLPPPSHPSVLLKREIYVRRLSPRLRPSTATNHPEEVNRCRRR